MSLYPLFRSLFITGLAGVFAPIVVVGVLFLLITILGYVPGLDELSNNGRSHVIHFLNIFGSGHSVRGVGILATVSGSVALLFDTYTLLASSKPAR